MKRNQHRVRTCNSVHTSDPAPAAESAEANKAWRHLLTWNTHLDEDTLEALTEALRPRRPRG
jgi:hypothetical protein